jgi:hypothetical protein
MKRKKMHKPSPSPSAVPTLEWCHLVLVVGYDEIHGVVTLSFEWWVVGIPAVGLKHVKPQVQLYGRKGTRKV